MRASYISLVAVGGWLVVTLLTSTWAVPLTSHSSALLRGGQVGGTCYWPQNSTNCNDCTTFSNNLSDKCDSVAFGADCQPYTGSSCLVCVNNGWGDCGSGYTNYSTGNCTGMPVHFTGSCGRDYHEYSTTMYGGSCDVDACDP
jgi:hypothetical protein